MALFSVRVAKNVRISTSGRGLRAHVGSSGARVHFGGGYRPGVSTGGGPFRVYQGIGGSSGRGRASGGPTKGQLAQMEKDQQFAILQAQLERIVNMHRAEFPVATKPVLAPPEPADELSLIKERERELLKGIGVFKRAERREAKERARGLGFQDAERINLERSAKHQKEAAELDRLWESLVSNEPSGVIEAVDAAFEDNSDPAAPVDVEDDALSLVMLAPSEEWIPERKPAITPSGKATTKKMTKAETADAYLTLLSGHLLLTIKEALATAPGIKRVKAVVVRMGDRDVYGKTPLEVLLAGTYARADLQKVKWNEALSPEIVDQVAGEGVMNLKGRPPRLQPVNLDDQPELGAFVKVLAEKLGLADGTVETVAVRT